MTHKKPPISTIRIPASWTRQPLPGQLWRSLLEGQITIVEAVRRWVDAPNANLADIERLALSISTVGLTEPILVNTDMALVSGLRRLLAHALLVVQGEEQFNTIEILIDRSRPLPNQIAETLVREDFKAVEMALNVGRLIAEIEGVSLPPPPYVHPDGRIAVPDALRDLLLSRRGYGTWIKISDALGRTPRRCRQIVNILRLCDNALTLIHNENLTESTIRDAVPTTLDCEAQVRRIQSIINEPQPVRKAAEKGTPSPSPSMVTAVRKIVSACDHLATINPDALRQAVTMAFQRLKPEDLEDAYQAFEVIHASLREMRNWHKGKDKQYSNHQVRFDVRTSFIQWPPGQRPPSSQE